MNFDIPPNNLEAEQSALGSWLLDPSTISESADLVQPSDFWRDANQILAQAIFDLWNEGKPVSCVSVAEELTRRSQLKKVGGEDYIAEVVASVPHAANARYMSGIVKQKSMARQLAEAATQILQDVYSQNHTAEGLLELAEQRILAVGDSAVISGGVTLSQAANEALYEMAVRQSGERRGVSSGFLDLDDTIHGFQPGRLYILAARPSIGKSCLALNIADDIAYEQGKPVLFVSLEMTRDELATRLLSSRANVDGATIMRTAELSRAEHVRLYDAAETVAAKSLLSISDPSSLSLSALGAIARRHKARHGLALLVIDYLQLIDGQRMKGENREGEVARISRRLKSLAKELSAPVLSLCQLNRSVEGREDRRPRLSDLRESGQIEADADVVMLLHRPDFYDPGDEPGVAKLLIPKNRGGQTGAVKLTFQKQYQRFTNFAPDPASPSHSVECDEPF